MSNLLNQNQYVDLSFTPSLNSKGDLKLVYNDEAIEQSLYNMFNTSPGSRPFENDYGIKLNEMLFEQNDKYISKIFKDKIINNIERYEPRVSVNDLLFEQKDTTVEISLYYTINNKNQNKRLDISIERT